MGEANTLQAIGKLQDDPVQGLEHLQQAQNLYLEICALNHNVVLGNFW